MFGIAQILPCISAENPQINMAETRHSAASPRRKSGDCAPHSDPLGCPDGRAGLWLRLSRAARSRRRRLFYGVTASDGFSQATVHADEPPSPHLRGQGEGSL